MSDLITNDEAQKLSFLEAGDNEQSKAVGEQKETNRKRIKNLRRRVYDSLNVLLACGLFRKEKKKVVFNEEFYECMPDHFKALYDEENDDAVSILKSSMSLRKSSSAGSKCDTPDKFASLYRFSTPDKNDTDHVTSLFKEDAGERDELNTEEQAK